MVAQSINSLVAFATFGRTYILRLTYVLFYYFILKLIYRGVQYRQSEALHLFHIVTNSVLELLCLGIATCQDPVMRIAERK